MATQGKFRILHTSFWTDPDMLELTPEQKLVYAYILTAPESKQCGITEIHPRTIAHHTGYTTETIMKIFNSLEKELKKIKYNPETKEVAVKNWVRWNHPGTNVKMEVCIQKELAMVKTREFISYVWDHKYDGNEPEPGEEEEMTTEKQLQNEIIERIFEHWQIVMKHPGANLSPERAKHIRARLNNGYTEEQCIQAIDGCAGSAFHMGKNETNTVYDSISLIFRNQENIDKFINRNKRRLVPSIAGKAKQDDFPWEEGSEEDEE